MFKIFQIFKSFSRIERLVFGAAFLMFLISFVSLSFDFIDKKTAITAVFGGEYFEGVVGQPVFINPVFGGINEADRDLIKIIFSDILELSESHKKNEDGKTINIRLKDNVFWHDGKPIVSDDVVFTIKTIQNPDSRSPLFSAWQGVEVFRVSERELKLVLPSPYVFFEDSLKELRPIPEHIFGSVPAANHRLSNYNFEPVGSGAFRFAFFNKRPDGFITDYGLEKNENYFGSPSYLDKMVFKFYKNKDELIKSFNSGEIDGMGGLSYEELSGIKIGHQVFGVRMPKYYALFFNPHGHPALKDRNVRLALNYAVDKKKIIEKPFDGLALAVNGPLILGMRDYAPEVYPENNFSYEKAVQILEENGWRLNGDGVREKKPDSKSEAVLMEFNLIVPEIGFLTQAANFIKEDWSKIGVRVNVIAKAPAEISDGAIKTRDYQMLIFGNIFGSNSDLFSFWHSSERFYPGLNLALYNSKIADGLIESIRKENNEAKRRRELADLQALIISDAPAVFLFSPNYFYVASNRLKGFDEKFIPLASDRFENAEKWYVKTARVFR